MSKVFLASNFFTVAPMVARMLHGQIKPKKALFITTAAEVEEGEKTWLHDDRDSLRQMGFEVLDYTITGKTKSDFSKDFEDIHFILVSGGNVFYLLEKAQQSGFTSFIQNYINTDENVYFGSSAGSVITGPDISPFTLLDDPSKAPNLKGTKGFGFIDLYLFVHWGSSNFKDSYINGISQLYDEKRKSVLLTNNQFMYVEGSTYSLLEA